MKQFQLNAMTLAKMINKHRCHKEIMPHKIMQVPCTGELVIR